jgi:hypothetical protein
LIQSVDELYVNSKKHMLIFCDSNSSYIFSGEVDEVIQLYDKHVNVTFTNSSDIMTWFSCVEGNNDIILYWNKEDTKRFNASKGTLKEWLNQEFVPLIFDLTFGKLKYILDNKIPSMIFFIKYSDESFTVPYNRFYHIAKNHSVIFY